MALAITNDQELLRAFVKRRHPDYHEQHDHIAFLEETYEGGREWFKGNIHKGFKEGSKEFKERLKRAYRFNHTREVVDLINKYIFKSTVARNEADASDQVKEFWKNATRAGLSIDQFMRTASSSASIQGKVWIFVDSSMPAGAVSEADRKKAKGRVYAYVVNWRDVLDAAFDDDGKVLWVLVRERVRDDKDPITSSGAVSERFRLWTPEEWVLFEIIETKTQKLVSSQIEVTKNGKPVTTIAGLKASDSDWEVKVTQDAHKCGRVPGFPLDNVIGGCRYTSPALIADTAYLDKAVANYLSNLDAIIQDQTFSQLAMPAQGKLPGDGDYDQLIEMGTKRIFTYDGEGGARPEFISPDPKQAHVILAVINKIINEIYHSLGMGGERTKQDNAVGIDNSSGVAKAYDFERLNSLLTTKSASLQNAENELVRLVEAWNSRADFSDDLVTYPDTFDVRSLFDEFTVAERLALIDAPKGVRQEQMKQVIDKLFPALGRDLKKKMIAEMEKDWPITGADLMVTASMSGDPPTKFPAKGTVQAGGKTPAAKNPGTQNRQGQVTSQTGK